MYFDAFNCDCIEGMEKIVSGSIDLILTDLPYGMTKDEFDVQLDLDKMWVQYKRIIKPNGVIALFAQGLFYAKLVMSNQKDFKYDLVWDKVLTSGFLNANKMPLRRHEQIAIFYSKTPKYHPQKSVGKKPNHSKGNPKDHRNSNYQEYGFQDNHKSLGCMKHPTSIISMPKPHPSKSISGTQKPEALLRQIILTYTDVGDVVLDSCMGASGSTGMAAIAAGRSFVGFEKSFDRFNTAYKLLFDQWDKWIDYWERYGK